MINPDTAPFLMNAGNLERTRVAPGMLMTFLALARDTGGVFALIDARGRQGMEPQPHIHSNEDESIYTVERACVVQDRPGRIGCVQNELAA